MIFNNENRRGRSRAGPRRSSRPVSAHTASPERCMSGWACGLTLVVLLWPAPAEAQIFGKGARTEFLTGFGVRTFASFQKMDGSATDGQTGSPELRVRAIPLSIVYGTRPGLSVVAILPFVDKTLTSPSPVGASEIGGDGSLGDAVFLVKWRLFKRDRGRGTVQLAVEGGVKAPTGRNDRLDRSGRQLPPPLQPGTGSWDPTVDFIGTYVPTGGNARWVFSGGVGLTAATEADNFEFGNRVSYDGMAKYRIHPVRYPGRDTFLLLELNGRWQGRATANRTRVSDSGGHVIYVSPGLQFLVKQNVILEGGVQLPVRRAFNGTQLEPSFAVLVGVRYIIVP